MDGNGNKTLIAEISAEYLAAFRQCLRITSEDFDGEIKDLILAAREDMRLCGVLPERTTDEADPLIKRAVASYVKAEFGLDNEEADKYRAAYGRLKTALALASDYIIRKENSGVLEG